MWLHIRTVPRGTRRTPARTRRTAAAAALALAAALAAAPAAEAAPASTLGSGSAGSPGARQAITAYVAEPDAGAVVAVTPGHKPVTVVSGLDGPAGVALSEGTLYITVRGPDMGDGTVLSVPADGGTPTVLASGLDMPEGIAVNGDTVFFTERGWAPGPDGAVSSVPIGGGEVTRLADDLAMPFGIVVRDGMLYFTEYGRGGSVTVLPADGGTVSRIDLPTDARTPRGIAAGGDDLYVVDQGLHPESGSLLRVPADGTSAATTLATGLAYPYGLALHDGTAYLTEQDAGTVVAVPADGGPAVTVATGLTDPAGIAVGPARCSGSLCTGSAGSIEGSLEGSPTDPWAGSLTGSLRALPGSTADSGAGSGAGSGADSGNG